MLLPRRLRFERIFHSQFDIFRAFVFLQIQRKNAILCFAFRIFGFGDGERAKGFAILGKNLEMHKIRKQMMIVSHIKSILFYAKIISGKGLSAKSVKSW